MVTELLHLRHTGSYRASIKGTPSRSRYLGHHSSLCDNGGPFTPRAGASDSSSTLLVQAVPYASRLRQMVCGQGLAMVGAFTPRYMHCCLRPHARLVL